MFTNPVVWLTLITLTVFIVLYISGRIHDFRFWNNGICEASGIRWKMFDTDSQGSRGYTDGQGHYCWISHKDVDRSYVHIRE